MFRVFVRWLHRGDIFYDSTRTGPTESHQLGQKDSAEEDVNSEEWLTEDEGEVVINMGGANYKEPVTWPYSWLFELYLFAVKHDAGQFRLDVQDIIHMKLQETISLPEPALVASMVGSLSQDDTLYQVLAHWHSYANIRCIGEARIALVER